MTIYFFRMFHISSFTRSLVYYRFLITKIYRTWSHLYIKSERYVFSTAANPQAAQNLHFPPQQNFFPQNPTPQQEAGPQEQQEAPQPQPAVQQQPPRDAENQERDWLDHFYMLSRIMVLFSIVYFYSSPLRFFFVVLLGFSLYLYQIGFFRNINVNNNNNNVDEQGDEDNQAPSRLMVAWTFFTTFFASLIPEIPNAVWKWYGDWDCLLNVLVC